MPDPEIKLAGHLNLDEAEKVIADCKDHPGGYDQLTIRIYQDGTGELCSTNGVSAPINFS